MEQFLRSYVSYLQDDWVEWLPMAEFTANNSVSETTGATPFLANSGQHPCMGFKPPSELPRPAYQQPQVQQVNQFVDNMAKLTQFLKDEMTWSQAIYKDKANRSRIPAPAYRVGDFVWLNLRHQKTLRPAKKLDWKNAGPFRVERVISPHAYRLELPAQMRIHPVFHTSLLHPAAGEETALPGQQQPEQPPIEVNGKDEYLVERIEDVRLYYQKLQYLVKWVGYDEPTWEPADTLEDTAALDDFQRRYPDKIEHCKPK
jgi:hypothetical protein